MGREKTRFTPIAEARILSGYSQDVTPAIIVPGPIYGPPPKGQSQDKATGGENPQHSSITAEAATVRRESIIKDLGLESHVDPICSVRYA